MRVHYAKYKVGKNELSYENIYYYVGDKNTSYLEITIKDRDISEVHSIESRLISPDGIESKDVVEYSIEGNNISLKFIDEFIDVVGSYKLQIALKGIEQEQEDFILVIPQISFEVRANIGGINIR